MTGVGGTRRIVWVAVALLVAGCGWVRVESPTAGRPEAVRATPATPEQVAEPPPARRTTTVATGITPVESAPLEPAEPVEPSEPVRMEPRDRDIPDEETTVVVRRGDTVYSIARASGRPVRAIMEHNRLDPPYRIVAGQRLSLPPRPLVHAVARGETLYGISRAYGVDTTTIARANRLEAPFHVVVGQELVIPGAREPATVTTAAAPTVQAPAPQTRPADARPADARPSEPVTPEASPSPAVSPPPARPTDGATVSAGAERAAAGRAPRPRPDGVQEAALRPTEPEVPRGRIDAPPPRSGQGFLVPVEGRIVAEFGSQSGGLHNDGINIAAPRGAPVRAADDGVVAYVGDALPGFGNLILIKHSDGWITAYAHNDRLLVERGQIVRRGQTVASVGSTGHVSEPQLHFELRRGERAVDPRPHLFGRPG